MKKYLTFALLFTSAFSFAQEAVLPYWETFLSNKDFTRGDFVKLSKQAEVELQLIELYLDVCQENLALPANENDKLKAHLKNVGSEIFTYNGSIKPEELKGYINRPHEYYLSQKQTVPKDMANAPKEQIQSFCGGVRKEAMALSIKTAPPK